MLKNAGRSQDDSIIRRMRIACGITKATNTLRICNIYCFSTARLVARTLLSVSYTYIACLVIAVLVDLISKAFLR